ncbi:MAG: hypothetical protein EPN75_06485 [Beijerinckiaceae bacterium]|nr:MAG: hypothetical protein EPN75_06485 [Beijerinckiaceae bacterium]
MTAQVPERIIVDGRPRELFADPLYRLRTHFRLDLRYPESWHTANYRGYIGTWEIRDGRLYLMCLCWDAWGLKGPAEVPISAELRHRLLRAVSAADFPLHAHWYNGIARIALGRRLVYSHQGWSHWFERERVIRFRSGKVERDREVDTRAILERYLRRNPRAAARLDGSDTHPLGSLTWFDDNDDDDWAADWWPPNFEASANPASRP